jgi:hypothetical protein
MVSDILRDIRHNLVELKSTLILHIILILVYSYNVCTSKLKTYEGLIHVIYSHMTRQFANCVLVCILRMIFTYNRFLVLVLVSNAFSLYHNSSPSSHYHTSYLVVSESYMYDGSYIIRIAIRHTSSMHPHLLFPRPPQHRRDH